MKPDEQNATETELDSLIGALVNGVATLEEKSRLEHLLRTDASARRHYRRYMNLHGALRGLCGVAMNAANVRPKDSSTDSILSKQSRFRAIALVAASVAALLIIAVGILTRFGASPETLARISRSSGARWVDESISTAVDTRMASGAFELSNGLIELSMNDGASVLLQAPVNFELKSSRHVALRNGRIVVRADIAKGNFVVETAHATVTDLGTEFGVGVGPAGDTQVQVFQGKVVADWKEKDGKSAGSQELSEGQAISIESKSVIDAHPIPFTEDRFIRTFPEDDKVNPALAVFNKTAHESIHVVPAPPAVTIDGDISDWDLSGQFSSACVKPYDKTYFVNGSMMYDAQYLYIGAKVGDPYPMRNSRDVTSEPAQIWEGGSVVIRLSTDKSLGWPLQGHSHYVGDYSGDPLNGRRAHDTSENIVHMILWYDKRAEQPRLALEFGFDYHGRNNLPEGWNGVFKKDADQLGYTLEYAIPWKLLNAKSAPSAGQVLATSWLVHWSDKQGSRPRGYLVEFKNPSEPQVEMLWGKTWGKAIFRSR